MTIPEIIALAAAFGVPLLAFAAHHGSYGARLRAVEVKCRKIDRIDRLTVRIAERMQIKDECPTDAED